MTVIILSNHAKKVYKVINPLQDCIVVFSMDNPKWLDKAVWGRSKGDTGSII